MTDNKEQVEKPKEPEKRIIGIRWENGEQKLVFIPEVTDTETMNKLTETEIKAAVEWLKDCSCTFSNMDAEDFDELTDIQIENAINCYFDGGIVEFKKTFPENIE